MSNFAPADININQNNMKKFATPLFVVVSFLIFSAGCTKAQTNSKLGYIDSNELLEMMPEKDSIQTVIESYGTMLQNQLQAMQMSFFFFLPSMLLSGFMFPFRGMPGWAQAIGEVLPLTHFLRIVRGIMLKGNQWDDIALEVAALAAFLLAAAAVALARYRETLD